MTRADLLDFMRGQSLAVVATVSDAGAPEAAVVGIAVTDRFEVVFDTLRTSRKARNLRARPRVALVIGGTTPGDERTVQYEGTADEPAGPDLEPLKELYFLSFAEGRERSEWPDVTYLRLRPVWIRYSDYNQDPPLILEFEFND
jgi:Pyridoxamine 5'-phosphate oxidase